VATGRREEALTVIAEHRAGAERFGEPRQIAKGHLLAGLYADDGDSLEHLEEAVRLLDPSPYRWDAAQARLELAVARRRGGERAAARELLMPALDYAEAQRAAPLSTRIREELAMCGARPRKVIRRGADSLTPAEARIARLAADGLQNKEIAQRLFLTVGSVQTTLVRVYRKLDVSSRRDIANALDAGHESGSAPPAEERTPVP
jgi:DNA-binding CsgD family transcriptional regulator